MSKEHDQRIADVCDDAYDLIDTEGWWDGTMPYSREENGLCIAQAIVYAAQGRGVRSLPVMMAVTMHVGADTALSRWNDKQNENIILRTLEGVADAHRQY